ncbi:ADP-ribosylglycohydrolase family protein [Paracoccus sp. M683]|nr:ADP-ribosylglycohydrolase family protein [uncultured Paracoccus sp.]TRW95813.1 ADP-ribosylglycohydrolase family protein [Paracoccus sp. M683]
MDDLLIGMLLGLAIGDAIGTTLEFSARDSKPELTDMIGGGPFGLLPGQWTDDTSMALCLADGLIATAGTAGHFDSADLMRRFANWWQWGDNSVTGECFDIGITTRNAIARFLKTGDPLAGSAAPDSAGNGAIMRLAPVAIRWHRNPRSACHAAEMQSRTTHAAAECLDAAHLMTHVLIALASGRTLPSALADAPTPFHTAIGVLRSGEFAAKTRDQIRSTGYVSHTLEAALWCVHRAGGAADAVLLAANLGDDADTVAAVTGQFAGAIWGASGFPDEWLTRLAWHDEIRQRAARLIAAATADPDHQQ